MKKFLLILATLLVIGGGTGVLVAQQNDPKPVVAVAQEKKDISYKGVEGKDALTLLKSNYQVETKSYDFGEMVESINGVKPDSKHFWSFYVNGQMSQVGAGSYQTKTSDTLEWKLDSIE